MCPSVRVYKWAYIGYFICPEGICWVHPVGYRFWWQELLDYFGTYLICLLKVKLPPIEKLKTRPNLPYPTPPYPTYLTKSYPPYPYPYPYPHIPQHHPYPHLQAHLQRHYIPTLSYPYWNLTLHSDSTTLSTTPSPTLPSSSSTPNTIHPYTYHILSLSPIEIWPKRLTAETIQGRNDSPSSAETTHPKNWPKWPRPKRLGRNDPDSHRDALLGVEPTWLHDYVHSVWHNNPRAGGQSNPNESPVYLTSVITVIYMHINETGQVTRQLKWRSSFFWFSSALSWLQCIF